MIGEPFLRAPRPVLVRALAAVARVASANITSIAEWKAALIDCREGHALLSGYSSELTTTLRVDGDAAPGKMMADAKRLHEIVNAMPAGEVELCYARERQKEWIIARGSGAEYRIGGLPADQFPATRESGETTGLDVSALALRRALETCLWAISSDLTNPKKAALNFSWRDGGLKLVGCDGDRIGLCEVETGGEEDATTMIFKDNAAHLASLLPEEGEVRILPEPHQIAFAWEGGYANCAVLEGKTIGWERMVSRYEPRYACEIDRESLSRAAGRLLLVADEKACWRVSAHVWGDQVSITGEGRGSAQEVLAITPVSHENAEFKFHVNAQYLRQALSVLEGATVRLEYDGEKALRLTGTEHPEAVTMLSIIRQ